LQLFSGDRKRSTPKDRSKAGARFVALRKDVRSQECNPASCLAHRGAGLKIMIGCPQTFCDKREIGGEF
jgi:hypothetical protein